jgi:transcriptional regulator with XRE-family HTH domain
MLDDQIVERFIELRAQGWTFARIADELQVSKPTLITWSRKHQHRLRNLQALHFEALAARCKFTREELIERITDEERRLREELARRELKDIPSARIFQLLATLRKEAKVIAGPVRLVEPLPPEAPITDHIPNPLISWEI